MPPREKKSASFAMWLRANALNVRRPFDRATWRTARPWLTYGEVQYELKKFRERSLGSIQVGSICLKNQDVECAVRYEALATKKIFQLDITKMINNFYDFSKKGRETKRSVLDKINEEFLFLERGFVTERDQNWKTAVKQLSKGKLLMLRPKMRERNLASLILELFDVSTEEADLDQIQAQLAPCLAVSQQSISAPILRRALAITGTKLKYKNFFEIVNGIIEKYYVRHPLANEDPARLKAIVNQRVQISHDNAVWSLIDFKIVPRHDFVCEEYEQAFNEDYHEPPVLSPLQLPFFRFKHPYMYVRKKQKMNWKNFIDRCTRQGQTTPKTLDRANAWLVAAGFVPYEPCSHVFNVLRVQGLSCVS